MTTQLPLEAPVGNFRKFSQSRADLLNTAKAQPTLKAKLEYFNCNIQSLAVCSPAFVHKVYGNWADANLFCIKPNCPCGVKSTPEDVAIYLKARTNEIDRLTNELSKRATYGEKVAYLITQPGFSFGRLHFDGIDLSPEAPEREPEDIATFNECTKTEFEKGPTSDWLDGCKATLSERLRAAADPESEIKDYREEITLFCKYRQPKKDHSHLTEIEQQGQNIIDAFDEAADRDHKAKTVCRFLLKGFPWGKIIAAISKNPLYLNDWEVLEHGKQVADLYRWLGTWKQSGKTATKAPERITWLKDRKTLQHLITQLEGAHLIPTGQGEVWAANAFADTSGKPFGGTTGSASPIMWNDTARLLGYLMECLQTSEFISRQTSLNKAMKTHFLTKKGTPFTESIKQNRSGTGNNSGRGTGQKSKPKGAETIDAIIRSLKALP